MRAQLVYLLPLFLIFFAASAGADEAAPSARDCSHMEYWDFTTGMCQPRAMPGMPMSMVMAHGNGFLAGIAESGPRGDKRFASPNMFMIDVGRSAFETQYFNVDLMLTFERWTLPPEGYPEIAQIGENNVDGKPYLDHQHPHSSPIMGLTFSDTISLGDGKDHLRLFAAPRGSSTEGPVAFMHRPTGMVNPDAPLGHHVGQDVGHIVGSLAGASLGLGAWHFEASLFNGSEPEPSQVDLPTATPNSFAFRVIREFSKDWVGFVSAAHVRSPEKTDPDSAIVHRYSASIMGESRLADELIFHNIIIYGLVNGYDRSAALSSFAEEFLLQGARNAYWGRLEVLQRTPDELEIPLANEPDGGRWLSALTLGWTTRLCEIEAAARLGVGFSVTQYLMPPEFRDAYGGNPTTAKIFLQLGGMKMWER